MKDERAWGLMYGLACGDALGAPTEFVRLAKIKQVYGPAGIRELPEPARWTDDAQMTWALTRALIRAGEADLDGLMAAMAGEFVAWLHDPSTPGRAPGNTCLQGARNLHAGLPWRAAGVAGSKGCGSVMRVLPVGYLWRSDPARLRQVADAQGLLTHGHPAARAACIAGAYMVKLALEDVPVRRWWPCAAAFVGDLSPDLQAAVARAEQAADWADEAAALTFIGEGWVAEEALALALYCVLRYPDDYLACVRRAANSDGDSDSIACLAGGLSGARLGVAAIPAEWVARIEDSRQIGELADRLADKRARGL